MTDWTFVSIVFGMILGLALGLWAGFNLGVTHELERGDPETERIYREDAERRRRERAWHDGYS